MIGPLTATIENLTETTSMPDGHTVYGFSGNALLSAAGYDVTPGSVPVWVPKPVSTEIRA